MISIPPTISSLSKGRIFHDAIPDGQDFILRFRDGREITVAWASDGPEVKGWMHRTNPNPFGLDMQVIPDQFRYVSGKQVKEILTDGKQLVIVFTDGHELRSDFKAAPKVVAVDAKVYIGSSALGVSGSMP